MAATRGRRVALGAAGLGVVVLVAAGIALKDPIMEEWWLYRLEHGDHRSRESAAKALGTIRSLRSVPHLIRAIQREPGEGAVRLGPDIIGLTPLLAALYAVGSWAYPAVYEQLRFKVNGQEASQGFEFVIRAWDNSACEIRELTPQGLESRRGVPRFLFQIGGNSF